MDGYNTKHLIEKYKGVQDLMDDQAIIDKELVAMDKEIKSFPKIPRDLEAWADSLVDIGDKNFKLNDFNRMFKISKRYSALIEKRELNSLKIREFVIGNLIEKIKGILEQ